MELGPDARRILELTREARTPSVRDKLRVEDKLAQSLQIVAISGAAGASAATLTKPAAATVALKWLAIIGLPALVAVGAGALYRRAPAAPAHAPPARVALASSVRAKAPEPVALPSAAAAAPTAEKVAARPAPVRERPRAEKEGDSLNEELDLLHQAQAAWRQQNPTQALALLAEHRQRYPKSVLGLEREALRVLSLCAAGRTSEAKEVARRSFSKAGRSPLRASVEQSCIKD